MSHEYAPRLMFFREQRIKAGRKEHQCNWCLKTIPAGQPKVKEVYLTDEDTRPDVIYRHPWQCYENI